MICVVVVGISAFSVVRPVLRPSKMHFAAPSKMASFASLLFAAAANAWTVFRLSALCLLVSS